MMGSKTRSKAIKPARLNGGGHRVSLRPIRADVLGAIARRSGLPGRDLSKSRTERYDDQVTRITMTLNGIEQLCGVLGLPMSAQGGGVESVEIGWADHHENALDGLLATAKSIESALESFVRVSGAESEGK